MSTPLISTPLPSATPTPSVGASGSSSHTAETTPENVASDVETIPAPPDLLWIIIGFAAFVFTFFLVILFITRRKH